MQRKSISQLSRFVYKSIFFFEGVTVTFLLVTVRGEQRVFLFLLTFFFVVAGKEKEKKKKENKKNGKRD